jgi:hypothetical protein
MVASGFYACIADTRGGRNGIPFGYTLPKSMVTVDWTLPDSVLAVYLDRECYLLFRWGPRRRRRRFLYRIGPHCAFNADEIAYYCAKRRVQFRA